MACGCGWHVDLNREHGGHNPLASGLLALRLTVLKQHSVTTRIVMLEEVPNYKVSAIGEMGLVPTMPPPDRNN